MHEAVHPNPQIHRHDRAAHASDRLGTAGDGAGAVGADEYQRICGGDLLRGRRARLGASSHAADQLDVAACLTRVDPAEAVPERSARPRQEPLPNRDNPI